MISLPLQASPSERAPPCKESLDRGRGKGRPTTSSTLPMAAAAATAWVMIQRTAPADAVACRLSVQGATTPFSAVATARCQRPDTLAMMRRRASQLYDAVWHTEARHPGLFNFLAGAVLALIWTVLISPWSAIAWLTLYPVRRSASWRRNGLARQRYLRG